MCDVSVELVQLEFKFSNTYFSFKNLMDLHTQNIFFIELKELIKMSTRGLHRLMTVLTAVFAMNPSADVFLNQGWREAQTFLIVNLALADR